MDYKVEFIKAAIEGGYKYQVIDKTHSDHWYGFSTNETICIPQTLLDPKCWECAGKTLGWGVMPSGDIWQGKQRWAYEQHAWLDVKQSNGDEQEFFRNLIEKK